MELSGKLDKMQYSGISCQTKLIMLFNQIIDFCFSDEEKTVDLDFFKQIIWYGTAVGMYYLNCILV